MTGRKTLISGFGNVLLGDDGFGVEVVKRLAATDLPPQIHSMDVGIAGMHFVLRLMEGFDAVIVVDAVKRGQPPGTLYVFRPSAVDVDLDTAEGIDPHLAEPRQSLTLARALGLLPEPVTVVGCEPASCQLGMPLSVAVHAAVDRAVQTIRQMVVGAAQQAAGSMEPAHCLLRPLGSDEDPKGTRGVE
jgi:hydrogenase maturation protease